MSLAKLKEKYNPLSIVAGHTAQASAELSNVPPPVSGTHGYDPEAKLTPADYDDHHDSSGAPVVYDADGNRIHGWDSSTPQPQAHDAGRPAVRHALNSWQDSAPVSRLSIYMKEHGAAAGIRLCQSNGTPHLIFDPGLGCADTKTERWQIANNMTALLIDATDDLKHLIANNLIEIPLSPDAISTIKQGETITDHDTAGPPRRLEPCGFAQHDLSLHLRNKTGWKNGSD